MKQRNCMRLLALALALVCVLSLAACNKKSIAGTYSGEYDILGMVNEELAETGISLSTSIPIKFVLDLKEDMTFTMDADTEAFKESVKNAFQADKDSMIDSLMASMGVSEEDYDAIAQSSGYDDYAAFKDDMVNQMIAGFEGDGEEDILGEAHTSGTYEFDDTTVTFHAETDDTGTLGEDGSITVQIPLSEDNLIDLVFTKQQ
ncbi:MAG: hypothetical protein J6N77_01125 [Lachnospiraceae bacterium]|nr:hypothetical protein [Lachnospiraceae bacterium]